MSIQYASEGCIPFEIRSESPVSECCLCIHGFTGSPGLYIPLARELKMLGYDVIVPLLPGHGTKPEDLCKVNEQVWYSHCEAKLLELFQSYEKVNLIGLSLGGALTTRLAENYAEEEKLGKLVLLSPGYEIKDKRFYEMDLVGNGDKLIPLPQRSLKNDGLDNSRYGYPAMPLWGIKCLIDFGKIVVSDLERIKADCLLIYSKADQIADPEAIDRASQRIRSIKSCHCYMESEHNVLLGNDRLDCIGRIITFLRKEKGSTQ